MSWLRDNIRCKAVFHDRLNLVVRVNILSNHSEEFKYVIIFCQTYYKIEQVDYLGQELTAGHKNSRELARRQRAAWVGCASIAEVVTNTADATLRAHMFNSTVLPAMLYGAETWSLTAADRQKLTVTERALKRRMVGVKKTDHVSNELLRKTSKVKDAVNQADQAKKRWAGHVARRSDGRWTRAVTEWLPLDIKRPLGGLTTRWRDSLRQDIGRDWMGLARDQKVWQSCCGCVERPKYRPIERL
ncbi:hypothetical protein EOD39_7555 [Acipenser ruthenus]|uniref:Endonuclease-reverse transcriptase n=1 Tax=Acipenser ruthenus TaxID=7906 RepID=A0A662YYU6_ACIRT|nr:hypothetical protein EOD39_7555 [Acipenser ruthenus]